MSADYRHNHYVPEWYQKRFMLPGQGTYWYLDLKPEQMVRNGHRFARRHELAWGPRSCFAEDDLYTTIWGSQQNVDIEKFFFGEVDTKGKAAVEFCSDFKFDTPGQHAAVQSLVHYMSVQKLRTPKGLGWLSSLRLGNDRNGRLLLLQQIQNMYCATWMDCIWHFADATQSSTKLIISDHPVTVYNRGCFPGSKYCRGFEDPDVRMVATHTYFPLSIERILILTNLAWVRNPYQDERNIHPNKKLFRTTIFNLTDIQTCRSLSEQEVTEINYITKRRALRYVAGAKLEWLYPERALSSTHWSKFGDGYLMMPEPREIYMGGEVLVSHKDGRSEAWNEYGHRPWEKGYKDAKRDERESETLERFKAEWAVRQGPKHRSTSFDRQHRFGSPYVTPDEFHRHDVERAKKYPRNS